MRVKNLILGLGIVIVYGLVLWQGIQAFYPSPEYNDFCDVEIYPKYAEPYSVSNCTYVPTLREKEAACSKAGGLFRYNYDNIGCAIDGYCDECQIEFNEAQDKHSRTVFFISLIAGIVTLIVGYAVLSVEPVGSALLGSGIWAIFYGTVLNWRNFSNIWRFLLLLLAFVLLIWFALRLNKGRK